MGAGVWGSVEREEPAGPVIATETPRAVPDREPTVDVAAHGDAQPGAGPPARLLGDRQRQLGEGDHVVLADGPLLVLAEDRVEIDAVERHEGAGRVRRRVRELVCSRG